MQTIKTLKQNFLLLLKQLRKITTWQNPVVLFITISLVFGTIFVVKTPPLWGGDETTHFARAYQISQGHPLSSRIAYPWGGYSYGGQVPTSVYNLIWHVNDDITVDNHVTSYGTKRIDDLKSYQPFTSQKLNSPTKTYFFPNAAPYSPIAYIPSALALKIASIFNFTVGGAIFLARMFGLLFYVLCIAYVLKSLRKSRFAWLVLAVSLLPMMLFQASIICADLVANALAILVVGLVTKTLLKKKLSNSDLIILLTAAVLLPIVKPNYIFLSFLLLVAPGRYLSRKLNPNVLKTVVLTICLGLLAVWTYATKNVAPAIRLIGAGPRWDLISISNQEHFLLHHPLAFAKIVSRTLLLQDNNLLNGLFGQLSFDFVQVPAISILASLTALLLAIGNVEKLKVNMKQILLSIAVVAGGVLSIFATFYLTFTPVADPVIAGVQGRYFLPFLLISLVTICMLTPRLRFQNDTEANAMRLGMYITSLTTISLVFTVIKFYLVLLG